MTEQTIQPKDDRLLPEREVAERWGISRQTMRKIRIEHEGPPFITAGNGARYKLSEVVKFEAGGLLSTTALAKRWGITIRAIQLREKAGNMAPRVKMTGVIRYRLNDILALEQSQSSPGGRMHNPITDK